MIQIKNEIGATPLDPDELEGLKPKHINTMDQLNEWEAANILKAEKWIFKNRNNDFLSIEFIKEVHRRMFDDTWRWAGEFRKSAKNIGVEAYEITSKLYNLLEDVRAQLLNFNQLSEDDIDKLACQFHHRLVVVHPFANGNGRHARLMTDYLLVQCQRPRFLWGRGTLINQGITRDRYLNALRCADRYDYRELFDFVRS